MKSLQKAIARFNKRFNMEIEAQIIIYGFSNQIIVQYGNSNDSKMYFRNIKEAIDNINQTYNIWLELK